uniref:Uncharacterized protein n=1 Tax=viral metagenome TaxID=1070528 RepID=A0A6C0H5X6_9ZZZZ
MFILIDEQLVPTNQYFKQIISDPNTIQGGKKRKKQTKKKRKTKKRKIL